MSTRRLAIVVVTGFAVVLLLAGATSHPAGAQAPAAALTGRVTSAADGPLAGVLVSARKAGSTVTVTVVSDEQGRYRFPPSKLTPGKHALTIRAAGYELVAPVEVDVTAQPAASADLELRPARDLAAQLTNAEWMLSAPGTPQQKDSLLNCVGCHTLERIMRSSHDAAGFVQHVLPRMGKYANQSTPLHPQLRLAERQLEMRGEERERFRREQAEFLASINLSSAPRWEYALKTLPRPVGRGTRVVITEYDLPRPTIEPHDVIVDPDGIAWYSNFGEQTLCKLDRKTEKLETFRLPPEVNKDNTQVNMTSPLNAGVDGKVWAQNNGFAGVHRLDLASGKFETFEPFKDGPKGQNHNVYDVISDSKNNAFFTDFAQQHIGRIDARTGKVALFATPTPRSAPRRGMMDGQDRLWFGEYRGNRIAMFDTRTETFQEWPAPTPWSAPYDVAYDKHGEAWTGSMLTDRILRLDPKTGQFTEYLLPRPTNIRRVFVDSSTTPVTFWVGSNHGASIIKLEPLD